MSQDFGALIWVLWLTHSLCLWLSRFYIYKMAFGADVASEPTLPHYHLALPERYKILSKNSISLCALYCMCAKLQLRIIKEKSNKLGWEYSEEPTRYPLKKMVYKWGNWSPNGGSNILKVTQSRRSPDASWRAPCPYLLIILILLANL